MFVFGLAVIFKLLSIQFLQGDKYKSLATQRIVKDVIIPSNRGNVYSVNGNLLATSIPKYDIRIDALVPSNKTFEDTSSTFIYSSYLLIINFQTVLFCKLNCAIKSRFMTKTRGKSHLSVFIPQIP